MSELQTMNCELRMANDELEKGIVALRAGQREVARQALAQAVCSDPEDARAWFWLSHCVNDPGQRRECLERVLRLDPANEAARRALGRAAGAQLWRIVKAGTPAIGSRAFHSAPESTGGSCAFHSAPEPTGGSLAFHSAPEPRDMETPLHALPDSLGLNPWPEEPQDAGTWSQPTLANSGAAAGKYSPTPCEPGDGETTSPSTQHAVPVLFDAWQHRPVLFALGVAVVVVLVCVLAPRIGWLTSEAQSVGGELLEAAGIIQAEEVLIASQWSGQIVALPVDEGDAVAVGDVIVQLDTSTLDARIEAARAAVAMAEARLAQTKAGARRGQIAVAEAQLAQAEAACVATAQTVSDTLALVEDPQDIRLQIAVTQAEAEAAQHHVARAVAVKDAAQIAKDKFENVGGKAGGRRIHVRSGPASELPALLPPEVVALLPTLGDGVYHFGSLELHLHGDTYDLYTWINVHIPFELHLAPNDWWQAWVGVNAAVAQQEGIQASLAHLYAQRAHPQSLEAKADEALAALAQAEAQVVAAQAQVDGLKAGATREQIAALEARLAQARAALDSLLTEREMSDIVSPMDGVVIDVMAHPGEVAAPGATLLTVADLSVVHLTVYLPEAQIGHVRLGQEARVTVDSFPGRVFKGEVTYIADRAEFTPRNVATKEERANLVFAVEVRISNEDVALKPGMSADAAFGE